MAIKNEQNRRASSLKTKPTVNNTHALKDYFQFALCTLESLIVFFFYVVTSKTSQSVTFHNYWYEVNSTFHVNLHYSCEAMWFVLSQLISLNFNFTAVRSSCWKNNLKVLKDEVCGSRLSLTFAANGKRQTANGKLLPSVFSSLYSRIKIFVFAVNSKRHFSIFVWFI